MEVLLDIQQTLLERTLRFPQSFFDELETGYLMSRLRGLRGFLSSALAYIVSNIIRLLGGTVPERL